MHTKYIRKFAQKILIVFSLSFLLSCSSLAKNGDLVAERVIEKIPPVKQINSSESDPSFKNKVDVKSITYMSDGLKVNGYIAIPKQENKQEKKLPCIIYNRGGNREFGAISDQEAITGLGQLASWGYVVIASQYRGNGGSEGREQFGGADVNDVLNLLPVLEKISQADVSRVGMFGWSRGGMMTYLALTRTNKLSAAVVGSGIADLFDGAKQRPEMETNVYSQLIPDYEKNKEAELKARSAVFWPEKLNKNTPILLLHGSADWRVNPAQALNMANKLYETQHPFRFIFFEGGDHGVGEHRKEANRQIRNWFDTYVRDKKPWPDLKPHGK
ncbi:MAG: prolyl oligopeptidase family serine peptidase [Cellvibrio sp.]